jgi:hypothetical protein
VRPPDGADAQFSVNITEIKHPHPLGSYHAIISRKLNVDLQSVFSNSNQLSGCTCMAAHIPMGIHFTETVAGYFRAKFEQKMSGQQYHVPFPETWDVEFLHECDHAIKILAQAISNQSEHHDCTILLDLYIA